MDRAKVAINGFGRIGRAAFKVAMETGEVEVVAVNDLVPAGNLVYLLKYDTVYGRYHRTVEQSDGGLRVDGKECRVSAEADPAKLPWGELGVDIVLECTGRFTASEQMRQHLQAGARMVILSTPPKGTDVPVVVYGVNKAEDKVPMLSTASCTTNSVAPVIEVLDRRIGVKKAMLTTIHAYTHDQAIVDGPKAKEWRRGRAAAQNWIPASTGAAKATALAVPSMAGRFDGVAVRGPVACGSLSDIVLLTSRPTTVEEVNGVLREEAGHGRYEQVLGVLEDPVVSSDIIGDPRASVVDPEMTHVVDGDLVKVATWYDNEWAYGSQMVREAARLVREDGIPERQPAMASTR